MTEESTPTTEYQAHKRSLAKPIHDLAEIFERYLDNYLKNHKLSPLQWKVVNAIMACRTLKLGGHLFKCDKCDFEQPQYDSCGNRHCPKCQIAAKFKWVNQRLDELLPIPYYHYVVTMPHLMNRLAFYNKRVVFGIFFDAAAFAINIFANDPRYLGAKPGFIGILHTWGQTMSQHVHLHFLIAGGGISNDGTRWINLPYREKFLFPVFAVSQVLRQRFAKLLTKAYEKGELVFPDELNHLKNRKCFDKFVNKIAWKEWYNYAKKPFAGPEDVVKYIGRYTHRIAISNYRILDIENGNIKFSYKQYKNKREINQEITLSADEFICRFLDHAVPERFKRVRHFGALSPGCRKTFFEQARALLNVKAEQLREQVATTLDLFTGRDDVHRCPACEVGTLIFRGLIPAYYRAPG